MPPRTMNPIDKPCSNEPDSAPGRTRGLLDAWDIVLLLEAGWRWGIAGMQLQSPDGQLHTVRRLRARYEVQPLESTQTHKDP